MPVFAADVGGTRIKLGLVDSGRILARTELDARSDRPLAESLPRIANGFRSLTDAPVSGVGFAFPSLISGNRVIGDVGKFADAPQLDLAAWAREEFRAPFAIDNDARLAALGEWEQGAGNGATDLVMVTLGTGIGVGVISEGRLLRGKHGSAGILGGHMTAQIDGELCPCGNVGCWETLASTAMLRRHGIAANYRELIQSASEGDEKANVHVYSAIRTWSALAVSLIHAYDPERLIFGGGVAAMGDALLGPIREYVAHYAWTPNGAPEIVRAALGDDAALIGAEALVRRHELRRVF